MFKKLVGPFLDDIMIKLAKHRDFPEERYEIVLENKQLKEKMLKVQNKEYAKLDDENKELRLRLDELVQENQKRLEIENNILKQELVNTHKLLLGKEDNVINSSLLTLGDSSETADLRLEYTKKRMEKRSQLNIHDITKFKVFDGKMIYYTKDGIRDVVEIDTNQLKSILESLLENKAIVSFSTNSVAQVTFINKHENNISADITPTYGIFYIKCESFVSIKDIKDKLSEIIRKSESDIKKNYGYGYGDSPFDYPFRRGNSYE